MGRRKYPIRAEDYELFELIGDGASAIVHRARCIPFDEIVAVKILDVERNSDLVSCLRSRKPRDGSFLFLEIGFLFLVLFCTNELWVVVKFDFLVLAR